MSVCMNEFKSDLSLAIHAVNFIVEAAVYTVDGLLLLMLLLLMQKAACGICCIYTVDELLLLLLLKLMLFLLVPKWCCFCKSDLALANSESCWFGSSELLLEIDIVVYRFASVWNVVCCMIDCHALRLARVFWITHGMHPLSYRLWKVQAYSIILPFYFM